MTDIVLTDEQKNLIARMDKLIAANGGKLEHDLSDPMHRDYAKLMHTLAGNDEKSFPGLFKCIDEGGSIGAPHSTNFLGTDSAVPGDDSGWETVFGIPEVGTALDTNLAAANGYGTVVGGFQTCNLSLLISDSNGNIIAHGSNAAQLLTTLAVGTDNRNAKPACDGMTASMTYTYLPVGGGSAVSATIIAAAPKAVADPTVTEPKRENGNTTPYDPAAINIGLGRPHGYLTNCDYIYDESIQDHPIGRIPLVGSVSFTQPVKTLLAETNFWIEIYVIRTDTGGQSRAIDAVNMDTVYENFFIDPADPSGKTLSWNLPMEANVTNPPSPIPSYNPVIFSNIPWSSNLKAYLTVNLTVPMKDGSYVTVIIQSSDVPDADLMDGVAYIMPVEFIWHCLAADTNILLSDGTEKKLSFFAANDTVKTHQGSGTVSVTHAGAHHGHVWKIETDDGHSLVTSSHHIIMTPDGGKYAYLLKVGERVLTVNGTATISKVMKLSAEKRVLWNLSLGHAPRIDDTNPEVGTFYANGILVGDARAERAMRRACVYDIEWVKANIDERFHVDVENTFKRRREGHWNKRFSY